MIIIYIGLEKSFPVFSWIAIGHEYLLNMFHLVPELNLQFFFCLHSCLLMVLILYMYLLVSIIPCSSIRVVEEKHEKTEMQAPVA